MNKKNKSAVGGKIRNFFRSIFVWGKPFIKAEIEKELLPEIMKHVKAKGVPASAANAVESSVSNFIKTRM